MRKGTSPIGGGEEMRMEMSPSNVLLHKDCVISLVGPFQAADSVPPVEAALFVFFSGETTEREKSMMYLTTFVQNRQGVTRTSGVTSSVTLKGKDRKHSVQVSTMKGTPLESLPFRGIQTGADSFLCAVSRAVDVLIRSATVLNKSPG